jgi:predicted enzyme related to lactoylglutathione lyase
MTIQVLGVDNILLAVGNFREARVFYEKQLGLPVKFVVEEMGIIAFRLGAEEPGLFLRAQTVVPSMPRETPRVWLEVPDARAAAQALIASGIPLLKEPWEIATGWVVECADPWGNVIGLTDYLKAPQKARSLESSENRPSLGS